CQMRMRISMIVLATLVLSGCLTHWIIDTSTRLQLENSLSCSVANLRVISEDSSLPEIRWIPDTLAPDSRGKVYSEDLVGDFHFLISTQDSTCGDTLCWRDRNLGNLHVDGGSILWILEANGSALVVDER
ncbi:MAG TPA: hypothetical protein VLM37_05715, partial [Fibrobacteraceae bacterium]|nr:hypothetical protein [Fibrobacteraceae bacterium]